MQTCADPRQASPARRSAAERARPAKAVAQRAALADNRPVAAHLTQLSAILNPPLSITAPAAQLAPAPNRTGLPDSLKAGVESLSGQSLDHVRVHRNSSKPAQLNAHAYAQGRDIHLAPGQEKHLPHEAWHIVQQAQGRVKPTIQAKGIAINDDHGLEREADVMGARAAAMSSAVPAQKKSSAPRGHSPLQKVSTKVAQRERLRVQVTGITHLVSAPHGSIMEGGEVREVQEGQVIEIETQQKLRSRRGPNQEIHRAFDRDGSHDYRWFRVLRVDGRPVPPNVYLRDATFHTATPGKLGTRPAIIKGHGRDRMHPQDALLHSLATEIVSNAAAVPSVAAVYQVILLWSRENKSVHDPLKTLRFMQIAYAFSTNLRVQTMLGSPDGIEQVQTLCTFLDRSSGRQFVQAWSASPANDVGLLRLAWTSFVEGIAALHGRPKLNLYLASVLHHDKGYAQTQEAAGMYFMFEADEAPADDRGFPEILAAALNHTSNMNVWGSGMSSLKISDQLKRTTTSETQDKIPVKLQEDSMWGYVLNALITVKNPHEKEWSYITTIAENEVAVFQAVRALVPHSFALNKSALHTAVENMGG